MASRSLRGVFLAIAIGGAAACAGTTSRDSETKRWTAVKRGDKFLEDRIQVNKVETEVVKGTLQYRITVRNLAKDLVFARARTIFLDKDGVRLIYVDGNEFRNIEFRPGREMTLKGGAPGPETAQVALDVRTR